MPSGTSAAIVCGVAAMAALLRRKRQDRKGTKGTGGLYQLIEGVAFTKDLIVVLAGMFADYLGRARGMPRSIKDLATVETMSQLLEEKVLAVRKRKDREAAMDGDVTGIGAGGTGTCRAWLELDRSSGETTHVFVKIPAVTLFERLFLTVFSIYPNELHFYKNVYFNECCPRELFSKVYHASTKGHRFCLVLSDISRDGATFPGIMDSYPRERVELVSDSLSSLHAAFWERVPQGVWVDEWSCHRTVPPTPCSNRPVFRRIIAETTLDQFEASYPGLMPQELAAGYRRFIKDFDSVRKSWSSGKLTLAHGDSHIGNMFFTPEGKCGFYDMQCVSAEPCMRDLTYHLICSYDKDALARDEKDIIRSYVEKLNGKLEKRGLTDKLSCEDAWEQYRSLSWWAMAAWVISHGLGSKDTTIVSCSRVCTAMMRIDAIGKLEHILSC